MKAVFLQLGGQKKEKVFAQEAYDGAGLPCDVVDVGHPSQVMG